MKDENDNTITIETNLEDLLLNDNDIEDRVIEPEFMYEVQLDGEISGPYFRNDLATYLSKHPSFSPDALVREFGTLGDWINIYDHPYFDRRKLFVAPTAWSDDATEVMDYEATRIDSDGIYMLMMRGERKGPYNMESIKRFISDKELLYTDFVSKDDGKTWIRIYELDNLERRTMSLPKSIPEQLANQGILNDDNQEVSNFIDRSKVEENEAVASLAFLGQMKRGKALVDQEYVPDSRTQDEPAIIQDFPTPEIKKAVSPEKQKFKKAIFIAFTVISFSVSALILFQVAAYYLGDFTSNSQIAKTIRRDHKQVKQVGTAEKEKKIAKVQERQVRKSPTRARPTRKRIASSRRPRRKPVHSRRSARAPASVTKENTYNNDPNNLENELSPRTTDPYYESEDGEKVAKDEIDRELDEIENEEEFEDERAPASEEEDFDREEREGGRDRGKDREDLSPESEDGLFDDEVAY